MKTIKLTIRVSGYLKEGDHESFDADEAEVSVECVRSLDDTALDFLKSAYQQTAVEALNKYYIKEKDYNHE
jgi:hypothetical protein